MTEKKECSEITDDKYKKHSNLIDDANKKCIYKDNACKEENKNCDKNCDTYNNHDSTPIDETICKAITPVYDEYKDKIYQCRTKNMKNKKWNAKIIQVKIKTIVHL